MKECHATKMQCISFEERTLPTKVFLKKISWKCIFTKFFVKLINNFIISNQCVFKISHCLEWEVDFFSLKTFLLLTTNNYKRQKRIQDQFVGSNMTLHSKQYTNIGFRNLFRTRFELDSNSNRIRIREFETSIKINIIKVSRKIPFFLLTF